MDEWVMHCDLCGLRLVCFGLKDGERRMVAHASECHPERLQAFKDSAARGPVGGR